jgi:hypothetical protein
VEPHLSLRQVFGNLNLLQLSIGWHVELLFYAKTL